MPKPFPVESERDLPQLAYIIAGTLCAVLGVILVALFAVGGDHHGVAPVSTVVAR